MSEEKEVITHYNCDLCGNSIDYISEDNKFYTADKGLVDICSECKEALKKWLYEEPEDPIQEKKNPLYKFEREIKKATKKLKRYGW